ncbi:MAG: enolase C-terminal domain-like protein [Rhodospirillales bacterium]
MADTNFTIQDVRVRSVVVPMRRPLVTRIIVIDKAALLLIDLETEEGVTGRSYLFGYTPRGNAYIAPMVRDLARALTGESVEPEALFAKARKALTMFGHEGLALIAVAGLDMAAWDAVAKARGEPLARTLGADATRVRAYNSNGLGIVGPEAAAEEAGELLAEGGFSAVKVRLGRETLEEDIAVVRAVRDAVGGDVSLPVDFNQCLDADEAIRRGRALDQEDVYWIEEPIRYDDLDGNARVAAAVETPVQNGENFYGPDAAARAIDARALDYLMLDAERIGGVTGWMRTAALAESAGVPVSSHLFPEISRHLLAATPGRHWLEYVDWAAPILDNPVRIVDGHAVVPNVPGTGIAWDEDAVEKYSVEL